MSVYELCFIVEATGQVSINLYTRDVDQTSIEFNFFSNGSLIITT
jgi:hypothetical protein